MRSSLQFKPAQWQKGNGGEGRQSPLASKAMDVELQKRCRFTAQLNELANADRGSPHGGFLRDL